MGWFEKKSEAQSVVLIDIDCESVGGAYARFAPGKKPTLLYTRRLRISSHEGERAVPALERTLEQLGEILINEGAPALARAADSGRVPAIIASIASPWESVTLRRERLESVRPFIFTKDIAAEALKHSAAAPQGFVIAEESILSTALNGYETADPYGRETKEAHLLILTSAVDKRVADSVAAQVRRSYHTRALSLIAATPVASFSMRELFPHEQEYLAIAYRGGEYSAALVRRGSLAGVVTGKDLNETLSAVARENPLPHMVFLIAEEPRRPQLVNEFHSARTGSLWLAGASPRAIPLTESLIAPFVAVGGEASRDLFLSLLALFYAQKASARTFTSHR